MSLKEKLKSEEIKFCKATLNDMNALLIILKVEHKKSETFIIFEMSNISHPDHKLLTAKPEQ